MGLWNAMYVPASTRPLGRDHGTGQRGAHVAIRNSKCMPVIRPEGGTCCHVAHAPAAPGHQQRRKPQMHRLVQRNGWGWGPWRHTPRCLPGYRARRWHCPCVCCCHQQPGCGAQEPASALDLCRDTGKGRKGGHSGLRDTQATQGTRHCTGAWQCLSDLARKQPTQSLPKLMDSP